MSILGRLHEVGHLIDREDESAVLSLVNQKDEFCQEAEQRREHASPEKKEDPLCHFCEGFIQSRGCVGMLARLNHAVLAGDWEEARRINDEYIRWVQGLSLHI
jgi:hypothetical protein